MTLVVLVETLRRVSLDLLSTLAQASLEGAVLATLVWLVCRAIPAIPAAVRTWLWWLVAAKLVVALLPIPGITLPILPARAASPAPVAAVAPAAIASPAAVSTASTTDLVDVEAVAAPPASPSGRAVSIPYLALWPIALGGVWLLVALVHAGGLVRALLAARRLRRHAEPAPTLVARRLLELVRQFALPVIPRVLTSRLTRSPLITGVWQPSILLPADTVSSLSRTDLDLVLAHELAHVRRGDLVWGWAPALASRLFFFHPLARLATREYLAAREEACDAEVLRTLDAAPAAYGRLLVTLGVAPTDDVLAAAGTSPTFASLQRRLVMLDRSQSPASRWWWSVAAATALLLPLSLSAQSEFPPLPDAPPQVPAAPQAVLAPPAPAAPAPPPEAFDVLPLPVPLPPAPEADPLPAATAAPAPAAMATPAAMPSIAGVPALPAAPAALPAPMPAAPLQPPPPPAEASDAPAPPPPPPAPPRAYRMQSEWVLLDPSERHHVSGASSFRAEAERQRTSPNERLLWFRHNGNAYVTRDASTIAAVQRAFDGVEQTSQQMGEIGRRMGEVGKLQGEEGRGFGAEGAAHAALTAKLNRLIADELEMTARELRANDSAERDRIKAAHAARKAELDARKADVKREFQAVTAQHQVRSAAMRELGERMKAEGVVMKQLGDAMRQQFKAADAQLQTIFGQAVSSGIATRAK